jgi:hypothetical protein
VIWFYTLGPERRICETRLAAEGDGYELVVTDRSGTRVERFPELSQLLNREHELLAVWRAQGWRSSTPPSD